MMDSRLIFRPPSAFPKSDAVEVSGKIIGFPGQDSFWPFRRADCPEKLAG